MKRVRPTLFRVKVIKYLLQRERGLEMSQTTITLLFLAFAVISFIFEKIPLGLPLLFVRSV